MPQFAEVAHDRSCTCVCFLIRVGLELHRMWGSREFLDSDRGFTVFTQYALAVSTQTPAFRMSIFSMTRGLEFRLQDLRIVKAAFHSIGSVLQFMAAVLFRLAFDGACV